MRVFDLIRVVWSNLSRMRGRAIMTSLGVMIGTAAIVVLIALASGLQSAMQQSFQDFGSVNQITVFPAGAFEMFGPGGGGPGEDAALTPEVLDDFREIEGVAAVTPNLSVNAGTVTMNRLNGFASLMGIDPRVVEDLGFEPADGHLQMSRWSVVAGAHANESFFDSQGRPLDETPDLYGQTLLLELQRTTQDGELQKRTIRLRVGAVLQEIDPSMDRTLFISLTDATEINSWVAGTRMNYARTGYPQAVVIMADTEHVLDAEAEILGMGFFAYSATSQLQSLNVVFTILQAVFGAIGAIALVVAAIGIANTMVMSVLERTREIGLMKAVGATNRDVMNIFLAEAGAIGVMGGIGGVLFGIGITQVIGVIASAYITSTVVSSGGSADQAFNIVNIPLWLPVFAVVFALMIGVASGIYPALRAVQLNPVSALKYE